MSLRNIRMHAIGKVFLILMFVAAVGACGESSSPTSKQETTTTIEKNLAQMQKQADSGDAEAQFHLGLAYLTGEHVPKDVAKGLEWLQKAVAQGNAAAQHFLGLMYHLGKEGVPKDATKAVEWYRKAAEQGYAKAQHSLGSMYFDGEGIPKDAAKAAEWYQKAAEQGNASAQNNLGVMYQKGEGVQKNATKAVEWYRKAAEQGGTDAQFNLGLMYYNGVGVLKDDSKAIEWYQKAAAQEHAKAQSNLGLMYYYGKGVPKDVAKAVEWYRKAAEQGNAGAQGMLGVMYHDGEGVPKDSVLAYAWTNLAAVQEGKVGESSKKFRSLITLSSAQRAEAERLSSNWKPGQVLRREGESAAGAGSVAPGGGALAKKGTGTAFVISKEGHAITNHHVVAGCKELRVQGRSESIQLITRDAVSDLALLKMPGETRATAALTPDPSGLRQGQDIVVFGFPLDSLLSSGGNLTPGVVSAITGLGNNSNQFQITAPIQPGSSGSPVMDKKGNIVGVVSMKLDDVKTARATGSIPQNVNFAINSQTIKTFLDVNKVPYKTGGSFFAWDKSLADLGDEARKWTAVVECWR